MLLEYLYKKGIYAARTVRTNRKYMPKDFCNSTNELERGEYEYISSKNVTLFKRMDKKLVFLLPNYQKKRKKMVEKKTCNVLNQFLITMRIWVVLIERTRGKKAIRWIVNQNGYG